MTVTNSTYRADYTGNGSTKDFTVPFYFLDASHIQVLLTEIATGACTTLALNSDYAVAGVGVSAGGTITTTATAAYTSAYKISILRDVPYTQETHYVENDPFPAASHEKALDLLTMEVQQLQEEVDRAVVLPPNFLGGGVLPTPVDGSVLGWVSGAWAWVVGSSIGSFAAALADALGLGNGDALVGVKAPLTGATARTQHSKNADTVSVFDWMTEAEITDVRSNTGASATVMAAIQKAVDAVSAKGGGTIFFPAGVYRFTGTEGPNTGVNTCNPATEDPSGLSYWWRENDGVKLPSNVFLQAESHATIIRLDANAGYAFHTHLLTEITTDSANLKNIGISGFRFETKRNKTWAIAHPNDWFVKYALLTYGSFGVTSSAFCENMAYINIESCDGIEITNNQFTGIVGDGITIGALGNHWDTVNTNFGVPPSTLSWLQCIVKNVRISNNSFDGIGSDGSVNETRQGISICAGQNVDVSGNTFRNMGAKFMPGAIDIEPEHSGANSNVRIHDNFFTGIIAGVGVITLALGKSWIPGFNNYTWTASAGTVVVYENFDIHDNQIIDCPDAATWAISCPGFEGKIDVFQTTMPRNVSIRNNTVKNVGYCFAVGGWENASIQGNTFDTFGAIGTISANLSSTWTANKTVTGATWSGGVATYTSANHGFIAGNQVVIYPMSPSGYAGQFIITGVATSTFTVAMPVNPGTFVSGGNATMEYGRYLCSKNVTISDNVFLNGKYPVENAGYPSSSDATVVGADPLTGHITLQSMTAGFKLTNNKFIDVGMFTKNRVPQIPRAMHILNINPSMSYTLSSDVEVSGNSVVANQIAFTQANRVFFTTATITNASTFIIGNNEYIGDKEFFDGASLYTFCKVIGTGSNWYSKPPNSSGYPAWNYTQRYTTATYPDDLPYGHTLSGVTDLSLTDPGGGALANGEGVIVTHKVWVEYTNRTQTTQFAYSHHRPDMHWIRHPASSDTHGTGTYNNWGPWYPIYATAATGTAAGFLSKDAQTIGGDKTFLTKFGCNGKSAQGAYTVNVAATDAPTTMALTNQLRLALIANGICV